MRAYHGYYFGRIPVLVIAPRMLALYAYTALGCYATTDYCNYRDFSFGVKRYVIVRFSEDAKDIRLTADGDTIVFDAGVSISEIQTLDALFKVVKRIEDEIGVCECCGNRILWIDPAYMDALGQKIITTPGANRRTLSAFCLDCLIQK